MGVEGLSYRLAERGQTHVGVAGRNCGLIAFGDWKEGQKTGWSESSQIPNL